MAPSYITKKKDPREKREMTPFNEEAGGGAPPGGSAGGVNVAPPDIPPEWRDIEAPINFTWVVQDELAGMGWPKSRDQVNFLVKQGIDHLITLAADKIPPHYAFPQLKWTMIPVEDFTGPSIVDIKKFIHIMAEARRDGEAVGVHCAEGRGRTGVICACYLIYYYDMEPWDAIRIMRRQRPGSVERKVQEETVVMFYDLLNDCRGGNLDNLEAREKEWKRMRQQEQFQRDLMICPYTALLPVPSMRGYVNRVQKQERMRRSRSMPKMSDEIDEVMKEEITFQEHITNFYTDSPKRKLSRDRSRPPLDKSQKDEENELIMNRYDRGTTPGKTFQPHNLKPAPRKSDVVDINNEPKHDLRLHFKEFMSTTNNMKRARSFSQPRDKNNLNDSMRRGSRKEDSAEPSSVNGGVAEDEEGKDLLSEEGGAVEKGVADRVQSEKYLKSNPLTASQTSVNKDKPVYDEPDNRETEDNISDTGSSSLTSSRRASVNNSMASIESSSKMGSASNFVPPQPTYKPASIQDSGSSSTRDYYARIRDRAEVTRRREATKYTGNVSSETVEPPSSAPMTRKFESNIYRRTNRQRSKTTEIDYCPPNTTTSTAATSTSTISTASSNMTIKTTSDDAADQEVETILSDSRKGSLVTSVVVTPPPASVSGAAASNDVITSYQPRKMESRTSSDSLRVEPPQSPTTQTEKKGRLSPFNRFRTSLVSGSSSSSILPSGEGSNRKSSPMASMFGSSRQRTESTSSTGNGSSEKPTRRFFYNRKSRTGPLSLDELQQANSPSNVSPESASATNSTSNLASTAAATALASSMISRSQKLSNTEEPMISRVRAKSEFSPRTAAASDLETSESGASASSTEYGGLIMKDNYFLAAAKKWASYDKPSYETPFSRSNWKRSNRKFNYSRFLNYTRETFV